MQFERLQLESRKRPKPDFASKMTAKFRISHDVIKGFGQNEINWEPLNSIEQTLADSGTDASIWYFEFADQNSSRAIAIRSPDLLRELHAKEENVRDMNVYFESTKVMTEALVQGGVIGWPKEASQR